MMRNRLIGVAMLGAVLAPDFGRAQEAGIGEPSPAGAGHWYVSLDMTLGAASDPVAQDAYRADHGLEIGGSLGLGYAFGPVRLEGQLRYESFLLNNLNPFPGSPVTAADTTGDLSGFGLMGNVLFDFGAAGGPRPFIGVGGGFLHLRGNYRETWCFTCFDSGPRVVDGAGTVAAGQAMAGLTVPQAGRHGEWFIGYRFLKTADITLDVVGAGPVRQEGVESHSFLLGVLYRLPP